MGRLTAKQKEEVSAKISSFNFSGFKMKLSTKITRHYKSFVGRDFKAFAQSALFILGDYLTTVETQILLALSKVRCRKSF